MSPPDPVEREHRRALTRVEELKSERFINYTRAAIGGLGLLFAMMNRQQIPVHSFQVQVVASSIAILLAGAVSFLVRPNERYRPLVKYRNVTADVLLLTAMMWMFGEYRSLKTPAHFVYFLVVALAAFRYSIKLTIYGGALALLAYAAVVVGTFALGRAQPGTVDESFTTAAVSASVEIIRLVIFALFIVVMTVIAVGYDRLIRKTIQSERGAADEKRKATETRDVLSRYVTTQVADYALQKGVRLEGERLVATVLFLDIRDFTRITARMEPEAVVGLLNSFLSEMVDIIFELGGTLDKFTGDGLMAIFGAPVPGDTDEENAIRAAIRMRDVAAQLNAERQRLDQPSLEIGIGVHTGEVIAGNIGHERRLDYTVIGSAVNLASRLEGLNKKTGTDILISGSTYDRVQEKVAARHMGLMGVRSVERDVSTYSVHGLHV